jgi:hypothetical protein
MGCPLSLIVLSVLQVFAQIQTGSRELNGLVVDENGAAVAGALVVASGSGFMGWTSTSAEGSFHVRAAGAFVSVRHVGLKARLMKISELSEPVRIVMEKSAAGARKMSACNSSSGVGGRWIGGGLKVNTGRGHFRGPVYGEHDSHWYVKHGKDTLHIVDGYAWHSGLPLEGRLAGSQSILARSWESGGIVGLDLSGRTKDGKRWRWLGAPVQDAIEDSDVSEESANYFDSIIESTCFGTTE